MKTREEMLIMIGDLFFDAYIAGDLKDSDSFTRVRAQRDKIYDAVVELYAELQSESYHREQLQVELKNAQHKIEELKRDYDDMREVKVMFSVQDLPFPDVEEMAPASELLGGDE